MVGRFFALLVDLRAALEFESHPSIGVDGNRVNNGQSEFFVKFGEGI